MVDKKITELSEQTSASGNDLLAIVDDPTGTPATNKITKANFMKFVDAESRTVLAGAASVVGTSMTDISGMSVAVSAGGVYKFESLLMINRGAAAITYGYGLTFPAMTKIRGTYFVATSASNSGLATASVTGARNIFSGDSASGSVIVSTISTARLSTYARIEAIMTVSANGVIQLQGQTGNASNPLVILAGSYMEVVRLQ